MPATVYEKISGKSDAERDDEAAIAQDREESYRFRQRWINFVRFGIPTIVVFIAIALCSLPFIYLGR